jgi:hypothetical protein
LVKTDILSSHSLSQPVMFLSYSFVAHHQFEIRVVLKREEDVEPTRQNEKPRTTTCRGFSRLSSLELRKEEML